MNIFQFIRPRLTSAKTRSLAHRFLLALVCSVTLTAGSGYAQVFAASSIGSCPTNAKPLFCASITNETQYWAPYTGCSLDSSTATGTDVQVSTNQATVINAIIGIAKTENLGQAGAIVGLMVGLDESGLKIYANDGTFKDSSGNHPYTALGPVSEAIPHDAVGNNYDSLGVFQQRITTNWSTISTNLTDSNAVRQLMDPAYSAEAFFGSPAGSDVPSALKKGLQNISGWQNMDPWVAAQKVQISGDPTGSNYKKHLTEAQQMISKYYANAGPVALPVSFTAGAGATDAASLNSATCVIPTSYNCTSATPTASILCDAQRYTGIYYLLGGGHNGYANYVANCPDPTHPPDNIAHGSEDSPPKAEKNNGSPGPCAVDCSGLVSMAVDDVFHQKFSWVVDDITSGDPNWIERSPAQAQPGDIVTHSEYNKDLGRVAGEHVEIVVSYDAVKQRYDTFGSHQTGEAVSTSGGSTSYYTHVYHYQGPGITTSL